MDVDMKRNNLNLNKLPKNRWIINIFYVNGFKKSHTYI